MVITILSSFSNNIIHAQPSGGPYGPVHKSYTVPEKAHTIFFVSPRGDSNATGSSIDAPTTIETAVKKMVTGDVIILRGGTYRTGNLIINQGVTMQPYKDEQPVFKGTFVANRWKDLGNGLWVTNWDRLFPSAPASWWTRGHNGKLTPLHKFNNDMVFINGRFLQSAGWEGEVNENTFFINYKTGQVFIGVDPKDNLVEITAYDVAVLRTIKDYNGKKPDGNGLTLRGITFTQYAYRALEIEGNDPEGVSPEQDHGKDVVGSTLENCEISYCSRVAAYLRGDGLTIKNCKISNTSTEGIYIIGSSDVLLENNIFTKNNIEEITGYFPAAVKIFNQCHRVTCNDNLIIDLPHSNGIWYDVGNVDGVFTNNWLENIGLPDRAFHKTSAWPGENGFFFEISKGAICAGNVFVNCEHGLFILNSCNVQIYQNTFVNSTACIGRTGRSAINDHFGWHPATGPGVNERVGHVFDNNLLVSGKGFQRPLLFVWQPIDICDKVKGPQLKEIDYNMYIREDENSNLPIIFWSPADNENCQVELNSPEALNKLFSNFSAHSKYTLENIHSVFKSPELMNVEPLDKASLITGKTLPDTVNKLLLNPAKGKVCVGAY